ncbi:MAG: M20/M25/M40 family metallo-hydrolase [Candidatus Eisenbacteria bacterium]|nr:M20/M25/M40 family metallo-hydrolase [Candidatus Eisenbacteria bacterium]
MRRWLSLFIGTILLVLGATATAAIASDADRALLAVEDPAPEWKATLLHAGVPVVRDLGGFLLVVAGPEEAARVKALGIPSVTLDSSTEGKTYFVAGLRDGALVETIERRVRVLYFDGGNAVIEASPDEAAAIAERGIELARVFFRPVRLPSEEKPAAAARSRAADPFIQQMVDSVDIDVFDANVQRMQDFVTRYCTSDSGEAAMHWIKAEYESYGIDSVYIHDFNASYNGNVVATIPGKGDPSKIVLIGGHYDSINPSNNNNAPGANDNATGTACAMECARALAGYDFNYTLVFMAFGAEEIGLYGSDGYASMAAARGDDIIAAVAVDMIGYVASGDAMDLDIVDNASSEWIRDLVFQAATDYVPGFSVVDGYIPSGASSDHASFWDAGYDAVLFFEDSDNYSPYIHSADDVVGLSYNSPALAENSVKLAVATIASIAEPFTLGIVHEPLTDTENTSDPYTVTATVNAAGTLDTDSLLVRYDIGSGWNEIPLEPSGGAGEYEAEIPAQPGGTFVDYYLLASDESGNRKTHPAGAPAETHSFFVGAITSFYSDDFESDQGWTVGAEGDDATTGIWERGDPQGTTSGGQVQPEDDHTPAPGVNCYVTGRLAGTSAGSYDIDGGITTLLSPVFDLSAYNRAGVSYWRWYTNSMGASPGEDDWRVSVNDGSGWVDLENTTESRNSWTEMVFRLDEVIDLTSTVQFRFIAGDEGSGSLVEAALDDFAIFLYEEISTGVAGNGTGAPARVAITGNAPNPFNPTTVIRYTLPERSDVRLDLYDVNGRLVRALVRGARDAGDRETVWDGRNDRGEPVASGVYLCRLRAGDRGDSRKIVLLR